MLENISPEIIAYIITAILAILSVALGKKWSMAKRLAKELAEALTATTRAIEDDHVTPDEAKKIIKEWTEVIEAGKKLLNQ